MFRFTIRDVLWLTIVVAMAVAWWLDRLQYAKLPRMNENRIQHFKTLK